MGCCGRREKLIEARDEQKWDFINLSDFKSTTCVTPLSYGILFISVIISIAVYGVDLFTAANLLFFDRWSGQVKPVIPFHISRWIFAACILLSWILLVYRWIRAVRVIRSGVIAPNYLDPLAVVIQSVRIWPGGRGWRKFLVFAELTKGRKGAEYVALFTYFSFEAWMRIIFAEGPRQVINALTLYSVMQANLVPTGAHKATHGHTLIAQFFVNVKILASHNREQAAILFGMLFTLIIWVIAAMSLFVAVLFYLTFLCHHIPNKDNGLSKYCRRKIDSRLQKIVGVKVNKALAKVDSSRKVDKSSAAGTGKRPPQITRQPTLPILDTNPDDKLHDIPLQRQTTQSTLPLYVSRQSSRTGNFPNTRADSEPTIPDIFPFSARPPPSRTTTQSSAFSDASHASNAPLMREAAEMGYRPPSRTYPSAPPSRMGFDRNISSTRPTIDRIFTGSSQGTQRSYYSARKPVPAPGWITQGPPQPVPPPIRQNINASGSVLSGAQSYSPTQHQPFSHAASQFPIDDYRGRTPGPQPARGEPRQEFEMQRQRRPSVPPPNDGYIAFHPTLGAPPQPTFPARPSPPIKTPTIPLAPFQTHAPSAPWPLAPPPRSGTAPVAAQHCFQPDCHPASNQHVPLLPARAATTGPGAAVRGAPRKLSGPHPGGGFGFE